MMRRRGIYRLRGIALIAIAASLAVVSGGITRAAAAIDFHQADGMIVLSAGDARRLKAWSASSDSAEMPLDASGLLLKAMPGLAQSCDAMIGGWGAPARKTAITTVRELGQTPGTIWIAYRCASDDPRLRRYYTERMAALDPARGALRFFRLGRGEEAGVKSPAPALYHVAFAEALKLRGGVGAASFFVYTDRDNPGRAIASPIEEDRLLIVAGDGASMRPALSLLTMRKRTIRADGGMVHAVTYRARLEYEHDANGELSAIVAYRRAGSAGSEPRRPVAMRYVWNPRAGFELARQPRQAAAVSQ
jgi:hypothetical protein